MALRSYSVSRPVAAPTSSAASSPQRWARNSPIVIRSIARKRSLASSPVRKLARSASVKPSTTSPTARASILGGRSSSRCDKERSNCGYSSACVAHARPNATDVVEAREVFVRRHEAPQIKSGALDVVHRGIVVLRDPHRPELAVRAVSEPMRPRPSSRLRARFEDPDGMAQRLELEGRSEPRHAGTDDGDVAARPSLVRRRDRGEVVVDRRHASSQTSSWSNARVRSRSSDEPNALATKSDAPLAARSSIDARTAASSPMNATSSGPAAPSRSSIAR